MKVTDFAVQFSRENILHLIDCYEDSPIYEEVLEEYERMTQEAYERNGACGSAGVRENTEGSGEPCGTGRYPGLFLIVTVGKE